MVKWSLFILVLFGNVWVWKILNFDLRLGLLVVFVAVLLFSILEFNFEKIKIIARWRGIFLVAMMGMVLFFQWMTTEKMDLFSLGSTEQLQRQERLNFYPKKLRRVAYWWELRPEMVIGRNVAKNFWQAIDFNYYFFANHPREQMGVPIIEKFSFLFSPFFLWGLFELIKERKKIIGFWLFIVLGLLFPIILISAIGHWNVVGPFDLFPFLVAVISLGILKGYEKIT